MIISNRGNCCFSSREKKKARKIEYHLHGGEHDGSVLGRWARLFRRPRRLICSHCPSSIEKWSFFPLLFYGSAVVVLFFFFFKKDHLQRSAVSGLGWSWTRWPSACLTYLIFFISTTTALLSGALIFTQWWRWQQQFQQHWRQFSCLCQSVRVLHKWRKK